MEPPPGHWSGQQTPGRAPGWACTEERMCMCVHLQPRVGRHLKHPSSSQFIPGLHLAPRGWAGCEIKLQKRLQAVWRGCFEIGQGLVIEEMKIWKMSPGVILQI